MGFLQIRSQMFMLLKCCMKLLNSVASILMHGEFLAWLVPIPPQVLYSTLQKNDLVSTTRMRIFAMLPASCTVNAIYEKLGLLGP